MKKWCRLCEKVRAGREGTVSEYVINKLICLAEQLAIRAAEKLEQNVSGWYGNTFGSEAGGGGFPWFLVCSLSLARSLNLVLPWRNPRILIKPSLHLCIIIQNRLQQHQSFIKVIETFSVYNLQQLNLYSCLHTSSHTLVYTPTHAIDWYEW